MRPNISNSRYVRKARKSRDRFSILPILGKRVRQLKPLQDTKSLENMLQRVEYRCRGFGRRHYNQLHTYMKAEGFPPLVRDHVSISFCKFKLLQTVFPSQRKDLIWIFKNFLTLSGQKILKDVSEAVLDTNDYTRALWYYRSIDKDPIILQKKERLLLYYFETDPSEWIPFLCFPQVIFEKRRMPLSEKPIRDLAADEFKPIFNRFIMELELQELFIPPSDILWKVGNQLYNDDGDVRKDYERPQSKWRCGFKYQYFLAQPLSPREVWLPDKFTKHNNLFWMIIGRQFLKKSPIYPPSDPIETWERIKGLLEEGCLRFDISGFGFQFPRKLLLYMAEVILELYPSDDMQNMTDDLTSILSEVKVEVGYSIVTPPRGIGLGYYEDLKTLVMLAILDRYDPISVYGDQGILRPFSFGAILALQDAEFLFEQDKVEYSSYDRNGGMKWAGVGMFPTVVKNPRVVSNPLVGSFFSREHWERKNALYSFYEDNKIFYKKNYKKIRTAYNLIFGYEFYPGDEDLSFIDGGISPFSNIWVGTSKHYCISKMLRPYEDTLFEVPYITPFKKGKSKIYPHGIAKAHTEYRASQYKRQNPISSEVFFYGDPRIVYNQKYTPTDRLIPDWADLLFLCEHGATTGNFFYGLNQERLKDLASQWSLAVDPLRAAARGGYTIIEPVYSKHRPLSREWLVVLEYLQQVDMRRIPSLPRVDLADPPMYFSEDHLYKDTDLYRFIIKDPSLKRKRSVAFSESSLLEKVKGVIVENMMPKITQGIIDSLEKVVQFVDTTYTDLEQDYAQDYENLDFNLDFDEEIE